MAAILGGIESAAAQTAELAVGYGAGAAVGAILLPATTTLQKQAWSTSPVQPDDLPTIVRLTLSGRITVAEAEALARLVGFDAGPLQNALDAAKTLPGGADLFDLYRRGRIDQGQLRGGLLRSGLDERYVDDYLTLVRNLPSIADLAMFKQQGFIDDATFRERSAATGFTEADAQLYFEAAGLPPGIETGLQLLRRKLIDEARFAQYVAEGHTKTKYTGDLLHLVTQPLSASVAAEALIRERISEDEAVRIAAENGYSRDDFLTWSNMLGRPIATGEAYRAVNRGLVGEQGSAESRKFFREVVARSDVRTEYADILYELRTRYPSFFQVVRLLGQNAISPELARQAFDDEGLPKPWQEAIISGSAGGGKTKRKQLAASIVETLYDAGLETHDEATKALSELGYQPEDADALTRLWLARRIVAEQVRGVSLVRGRYTTWKIDRHQAMSELVVLVDEADTRERLLKFWDVEREANAPVLTLGEIKQAFKYGRYSFDQANEALQRLGWSQDDALTHLWIEAHGDPRPKPGAAA